MGGPSTYRDFDVAVTRRGDELEVRVLDSPAGETGAVRASLTGSLLDGGDVGTGGLAGARDVRPGRASTGPVPDAATGEALFTALFHGDVRTRYRESVHRAGAAGAGVRLVLRFDGGADALPWELLWDPEHRRFLGLDPRTPVVRCTEMPARDPAPPVQERLRILLAVSAPDGLSALDVHAELTLVTAQLRPLLAGTAVEIELLQDASLDGIRRAIDRHDVHVFHYLGHGSRLPDGRSTLELTAADGSVSTRSAADVAAVLAASPALRLVVLNSCHGSPGDPDDPFAGAAAILVKAGVPAVVAMRRSISDRAAITFAGQLYSDLVAGERIELAVTRGRAALATAEGSISTEWSTVALHLGSSLAAELTASPLPRLDEDVQFTVSRPSQLRVERWEPMLVFAHHGARFRTATGETVDQPAQVGQRIAGFFGADLAGVTTTTEDAAGALPRGAGLVVEPDLPGIDCDPARAPMTWTGDIAEVRFLLRAPSHRTGTTVHGWVRVFCGPLVIAETVVDLGVVADPGEGLPPPGGDQAMRRYRRIFPCFAPEDAELVDGVVAVAEALGDRYTADVVSAQRDGAPSSWTLPLIASADVFQLFWSTHSMSSPACKDQWEAALATDKDDFIRPLYWEQPFPRADGLPPPALEAIRFVKLPGPSRTTTGSLWPIPQIAGAPITGEVRSPPGPAPAPSPPTQPAVEAPGELAGASPPEPPAWGGVTPPPAPSPPPPPPPSSSYAPTGNGAPVAHPSAVSRRAPRRRWPVGGLIAGVVLFVAGAITGTPAQGPSGVPPPPVDPPGGDGGTLSAVLVVAGFACVVVSLVALILRWRRRRRDGW